MKKKKILIIDDELDFIEVTRNNLERAGYEVYSAIDGKEGIDKFRESKPDLVLLDILMPKVDGFEVLRRLRSSYPEARGIPVIMLTAKRESEFIFKSIKYRATDYVMKPFSLRQLLDLVEKYTELYRLEEN